MYGDYSYVTPYSTMSAEELELAENIVGGALAGTLLVTYAILFIGASSRNRTGDPSLTMKIIYILNYTLQLSQF